MRRIAIWLAVSIAILALPVASAQATFHMQNANEVMLKSATGDAGVQFVELYDAGGSEETFAPTFGPFNLVVYDPAGHKLGSQQLSGSGMASASSANRQYLISTAAADSALAVTGDEKLAVALPTGAGQACYTAMGETAYSCITWGCITTAVMTSGTGSFPGAVPPDGQSAQRQGDNSVQLAAPTPKAPNTAGTSAPACPGQFAGVTVGGGKVKVKSGKAPIAVSCPATAKTSCDGSVVLKTVKTKKKKAVKLGTASFSIAPGASMHAAVKLSKSGKTALAKQGKLKTVATATAHDGTGKPKVTSANVTLKPAPKKKKH